MSGEQMQLECCVEVGTWPYPAPCPVPDCPPRTCDTGGCDGEIAWCLRGQLACGRILPEWRVRLMGGYERRCYERDGLV